MPKVQGPVKIVLVTGYLGAGKTTLLNSVLANDRGLRAAVIVNDIGEVNIDAELIREGGAVERDSVIPLTNGCICCTLSGDLAAQLGEIAASGDFDYIVIEASGICEPMPIAYTISEFCKQGAADAGAVGVEGDTEALDSRHAGNAPAAVGDAGGEPRLALDNIIAVVDCARMIDEFDGGRSLVARDREEDDVENLLVQQIEFCSTLVLNKTDLVTPEQLAGVRVLVRSLQKDAALVEAVRGDVPLDEVVDTGRFNFDAVYQSAAWLDMLKQGAHSHVHGDRDQGDGDACGRHRNRAHDDRNCAHEHAHHHRRGAEELEYGISTFVYERRRPFRLEAFSDFVNAWPDSVIRAKGIVWIDQQPDTRFTFEQAGRQRFLTDNGPFVAALPEEERQRQLAASPGLRTRWDSQRGDRIIQLVFIGRNVDRPALEAALDACLA